MKQVEADPSGRFIRYETVLGRGSYKIVYKGFDTHEAVEVAWNKLQVDRVPQDQIEKVEFEVQLLKRLDHKNIINLFAAWHATPENSKPSMDFITELMSSGTLKEYLMHSRVMKLKVIRRWCFNLLDAITYLHDQKPPVMHRDLKCDNIFINGHVGEVKVGDLGLSGVKQDAVAQSVIGTPEFMAPELYEEAYTEKVDVYAFGMCMLEMLTMEYPYSECENPAQIFRKVFSGERPLSFQRLPNCEVKQVIASCLEREKRRPTARQLLQHPFFSDWATDDGVATNLSIASNKLRLNIIGKAGQQKPRTRNESGRLDKGMVSPSSESYPHLQVGQSVVFNSDAMKREVLLAREKLDQNMEDPQIIVTSANDGLELRIAITIPVDGEAKKVEFFFNPDEDDVRLLACELVEEFVLHDVDVDALGAEITKQIETQVHEQKQEREYGRVCRERDEREAVEEHFRLHAKIQSERALKSQQEQQAPPAKPKSTRFSETISTSCRMTPGSPNDAHSANIVRDGRATRLEPVRNSPPRSERPDTSIVPSTSTGQNDRSVSEDIYLKDHEISRATTVSGNSSIFGGFDEALFKANMALMNHCANGKFDTVKQKLEQGADADFADYDQRTPLHLAATEGHSQVVQILLDYKADPEAEDRWGAKPFDSAKENGHDKVLDVFIQNGGQADDHSIPRSEVVSMELMQYSANGFDDMVKETLMAGAKPTFADYDKRTPLHLACAEGHDDVVEVLLLNGANPMFEDRFGSTPMDEAVKNGNMDMVQLLKRYGGTKPAHLMSKEDADYQYGMDLISHASRGRVLNVTYLLQHGAIVNYADYDKRTALHLACAEGHLEVVKVLLNAGADVLFKDRWDITPFDEARKNKHDEVAAIIAKSTKFQNPSKVEVEPSGEVDGSESDDIAVEVDQEVDSDDGEKSDHGDEISSIKTDDDE